MTLKVKTISWRIILAIAVSVGLLATASNAQETATYQSEYSAYNQAVENGDREAAERHGRAAWQLAEETLGDHQVTGVLAFNYGQLVIFSNAEDARAALRRAKKLREDGLVELPEIDLDLFLAYSEFAFNRQRLHQTNRLRETLLAVEASGISTIDTATMWLHLAAADFKNKRYKQAILAAEKAENTFTNVAPEQYQQIGNAIVIAGAAKIIPFPRKIEDVVDAHENFERAIRLFPPQKDFESFDLVLAQAYGWFSAADAAIGTMGFDHREVIPENDRPPLPPLFAVPPDAPKTCNVEWESRPPLKYPTGANIRGYIGAVIAVFDIGDDLLVHNPRILTEVPIKTFSREILKNMDKWKLKSPPSSHPYCRQNLSTTFHFIIVN